MKRLFLLIFFLLPSLSYAQLRIEAQRVFYDGAQKLIHFQEEVRGWDEERYFEGDELFYWPDEKKVLIKGNCLLKEGEDWIRGDKIFFDLEKKEGEIENGKIFISQKHFYVTGTQIKKIGPDRYTVKNASLTSCDDEKPPWKFTAKNLEVQVEGYGKVSWLSLKVKELPIFSIPWAIFPVKTERQTGFLIPSLEISNRYGPQMTVPFFLVLSENQDLTFYLTQHGDGRGRGFKGGIEYRYALKRSDQGEIRVFGLHDRLLHKDRWAIFSRQKATLPYQINGILNLNLVSDDLYPWDFGNDLFEESRKEARSKRTLESTLFLSKTWSFGEATLKGLYFQDLTTKEDEKTLHRLPELTFRLFRKEIAKSGLYFEMETQGVNFFREEDYRGQRFQMVPKLSYPTKLYGFLNFEPWTLLRTSLYFTQNPKDPYKSFSYRVLPEGGFSLSALGFKSYNAFSQNFLHLVEPKLNFSLRPKVKQSENPIYDSSDRLKEEALFTLELLQRIQSQNKEAVWFKISQSYDVFPGLEEKERLKPLIMQLKLNPSQQFSFSAELNYDYWSQKIKKFNSNLSFSYGKLSVGGDYTYDKSIQVESMKVNASLKASEKLDFYFSHDYDFHTNSRVKTSYGLYYRHQCWELGLKVEDIGASPLRGRKAEWKVLLQASLRGVGSIGLKGGVER
jgi:LPS-assembly protein